MRIDPRVFGDQPENNHHYDGYNISDPIYIMLEKRYDSLFSESSKLSIKNNPKLDSLLIEIDKELDFVTNYLIKITKKEYEISTNITMLESSLYSNSIGKTDLSKKMDAKEKITTTITFKEQNIIQATKQLLMYAFNTLKEKKEIVFNLLSFNNEQNK